MSEQKYRYQNPKNPEQYVEAIYEELSLSPHERDGFWPTQTVKDNIAALLDHMKHIERERRDAEENESNSVDWALGALVVLSVVFLFNGLVGSNDWQWLDNHRFAIRLWGVAFSALFVGLSIERSSLFKSLWAFGFTKLVASLSISALLIFSAGRASSLVNAVFPIDASALPYTRAIVAGLLAFQYCYPLLVVVAIFAMIHGLNAFYWLHSKWSARDDYRLPPIQSIAFLVLSIIVLLVLKQWISKDFSDEAWPAKVYRLAHVLDFNSKYQCANVPDGLSVVFLGPTQARVLVDVNNTQTNDIESFVDGRISGQVEVPSKFYIVPCEPRQPATNAD